MGNRNGQKVSALELVQYMTTQTLHFAAAAPEASGVTGDIILALNRLAGAARGQSAAEIENLIARLLSLLSDSPVHQAYVETMLMNLNALAQLHGIGMGPPKSASSSELASRSARRKQDINARYEVRHRGDDEYLVEIRAGSGNESSISRADYDAAILMMVSINDGSKKFDEMLTAFQRAGGGSEPYRLRVILRFWRIGGPPLITRRAARYSMLVPAQLFAAAADALWHQQV